MPRIIRIAIAVQAKETAEEDQQDPIKTLCVSMERRGRKEAELELLGGCDHGNAAAKGRG
jgi:hypothetical protein